MNTITISEPSELDLRMLEVDIRLQELQVDIINQSLRIKERDEVIRKMKLS